MRISTIFYTTAIWMALVWSSCYTRKDGCLDILAKNYDVTADDACVTTCCTYPQLVVSVENMVGDSTFNVLDTLTTSRGQKYRIIDLRCYFSDFTLFQKDGKTLKINEIISNSDKTVSVYDDMKIWRWVDAAFSPGTIKGSGTFDSIQFILGLPTPVLINTFTNLTSDHPLLTENKLKDTNGNTIFMSVRCVRYLSITDTINLFVPTSNIPNIFAFTKPTTIPTGTDINIKIKSDFQALLHNVDINQSQSSINNLMALNIKSFILVD